ncbi:MAG: phosphoheptose isomerase [Nitrospinae bacterium CG11_big_fil_rev_8_21_14_0_20_45_15]|nr:MAG: phosphoheptose isomerase [Nitrospinae bacterium CG11_big_fil_rev_8_21_14_0_20_45_15]
MKTIAKQYYNDLNSLLGSISVSDQQGRALDIYQGIELVGNLAKEKALVGNNKLMFIGNGASAAISSHMATDYWKNGGLRAVAFNDSSLLTCISNDYGYVHVFEKPIEMFADKGDILFAISSSGKSENILRGVAAARNKGCQVVTFSGFKDSNPLKELGDYNFYVPSEGYGPVEIIHLSICHCIIDAIIISQSKVHSQEA